MLHYNERQNTPITSHTVGDFLTGLVIVAAWYAALFTALVVAAVSVGVALRK